MVKRILAVVLSLVIGSATAAHAESPKQSAQMRVPFCSSGYICIYQDTQGTSLIAKKYWTDWQANYCYGMSSLYGRVGYVVNNSPYTIVVYLNDSCSGTYSDLWAYSYGPMDNTWRYMRSWFRPS